MTGVSVPCYAIAMRQIKVTYCKCEKLQNTQKKQKKKRENIMLSCSMLTRFISARRFAVCVHLSVVSVFTWTCTTMHDHAHGQVKPVHTVAEIGDYSRQCGQALTRPSWQISVRRWRFVVFCVRLTYTILKLSLSLKLNTRVRACVILCDML